MESSVSASNELAENLVESEKALVVSRAEVASLKEKVVHADAEKTDAKKNVAEVLEEAVQCTVHLDVALVGRNRAERLMCLLVTEYVNAVDVVVLQLGQKAVNRLRKGLERAYSTVRVLFPAALTRILGVAASSIRWKDKGSEGDGESELVESSPPRPGKVPQKLLGLVDLVGAMLLAVSFLVNTCLSLSPPLDFCPKCVFVCVLP